MKLLPIKITLGNVVLFLGGRRRENGVGRGREGKRGREREMLGTLNSVQMGCTFSCRTDSIAVFRVIRIWNK